MKQFLSYSLFFVLTLLIIQGCGTSESIAKTDESEEPDRNMGGVGVPRGVTQTSDDLAPGYLLTTIPNSAKSYLIDREGMVTHIWQGTWSSFLTYLLDDGSVLRNASDPDFPRFYGGGNAGRIQIISWEGDLIWDFEYASDSYLTHHDLAMMPNGNVLAISWTHKSKAEVLAAGRLSKYTPEDGLWPDKVIEIKPDGLQGGEIVWEWHMWDRIIQHVDYNLPNYMDPSMHPERLDINASAHVPDPIHADTLVKRRRAQRIHRNVTTGSDGCDVHHVNAINYNADLDQIVISSPELGEVFIIDHSTTTEEAAGHTGGRWGKGGDFLFRWGNPQNYGRGDSTDQRLFYQHDVRWIEEGKPGAGNLTVYNNNIPGGPDSMNYSAIYELETPKDNAGNYVIEADQPFGPVEPTWKYIAPDTISFYGSYISGAHRMANGNTFINCGPAGRIFEVNPDGEIVWEYWNQHRGKRTRMNGDPRPPGGNPYSLFRAIFIPEDHPGLSNRDLIPLDPQPEIFKVPEETD